MDEFSIFIDCYSLRLISSLNFMTIKLDGLRFMKFFSICVIFLNFQETIFQVETNDLTTFYWTLYTNYEFPHTVTF